MPCFDLVGWSWEPCALFWRLLDSRGTVASMCAARASRITASHRRRWRWVLLASVAAWLSLDVLSSAVERPADVVLVSRAGGTNGAKANGSSYQPQLSANGRRAVFESLASNLTSDDRKRDADVFVRDLARHKTMLVSHANVAGATMAPTGNAISANGRFVVYQGTTGHRIDIYVRDLRTGSLVVASRASGPRGRRGNGDSSWGTISANGRWVLFHSEARNLTSEGSSGVFLRDLRTNRTELVVSIADSSGPEIEPVLAGNGRYVAFKAGTVDAGTQLFVFDRVTGAIEIVSRASGADGALANGLMYGALMSADGRVVSFLSAASNLTESGTAGETNVYVRDLRAQTTTRVSDSAPPGTPGRGYSDGALSSDGRFIVFLGSVERAPGEPPVEAILERDLELASTAVVATRDDIGGRRPLGFSIAEEGDLVAFSAARDSGSSRVYMWHAG
jgi:Tol biopolymer transport system component